MRLEGGAGQPPRTPADQCPSVAIRSPARIAKAIRASSAYLSFGLFIVSSHQFGQKHAQRRNGTNPTYHQGPVQQHWRIRLCRVRGSGSNRLAASLSCGGGGGVNSHGTSLRKLALTACRQGTRRFRSQSVQGGMGARGLANLAGAAAIAVLRHRRVAKDAP